MDANTYEQWTESMNKYTTEMNNLCNKMNYTTPENPGSMPHSVTYKQQEYTLIPTTHPATCDEKQCQERFQIEDYLETGLYATFYPILPIYTHKQTHELCALCIGINSE